MAEQGEARPPVQAEEQQPAGDRARKGRQLPTVPPTVLRRSLPPSPRSNAALSGTATIGPSASKIKAALKEFFGLQGAGEGSSGSGTGASGFSVRSRSKSASPTGSSGRRGLVLTLVRCDSPTEFSPPKPPVRTKKSRPGLTGLVPCPDIKPPLRTSRSLQDPGHGRNPVSPTHAQRIIALVRSKSSSASPSEEVESPSGLPSSPGSPSSGSSDSARRLLSPAERLDRARVSLSPEGPDRDSNNERKLSSSTESSVRRGILKSPRSPAEAKETSRRLPNPWSPTSPVARQLQSPPGLEAQCSFIRVPEGVESISSASEASERTVLTENVFQPVVPARKLKFRDPPPPPKVARFVNPTSPTSILKKCRSPVEGTERPELQTCSQERVASPPSDKASRAVSPTRSISTCVSPSSVWKVNKNSKEVVGNIKEGESKKERVRSPSSAKSVKPVSPLKDTVRPRSAVSPRSSLNESGTVSPKSSSSCLSSPGKAKSRKKYPAPSPPTSPPGPKSPTHSNSPAKKKFLGEIDLATPLKSKSSTTPAGRNRLSENPARSKSPPELSVYEPQGLRKPPLRNTKSDPGSAHLKHLSEVKSGSRDSRDSGIDESDPRTSSLIKPTAKKLRMESDVTESDFSDFDMNMFAQRPLNSPHLTATGDGTGVSRSKRQYEHNWDAEPEPLLTDSTKRQKNRTSGAYDFHRGLGSEDSDDRPGRADNRDNDDESDDSHYMIPHSGDVAFQHGDTSAFASGSRPGNLAGQGDAHGRQGNAHPPKMAESSSSFDSNTDDTVSDSSSPVHRPVYGRYRKLYHDSGNDDDGENFIERLILHRLPGENLGMVLGVEASQEGSDRVDSVVVKSVTLGGAAYRATGGTKGLCTGDEILAINGRDLRRLKYDECLAIFPEMPLRVELTVKRAEAPRGSGSELSSTPRGSGPGSRAGQGRAVFYDSTASEQSDVEDGLPEGFSLVHVQIEKPPEASLGLSIVPSYGSTRDYYQIKRLLPSGVCSQSGGLQVGDRLVACNGFKLRRITQTQCLSVLKNSGDSVLLTVLRQKQNDSTLDFQYSRTSGSSESELQESSVKSPRDRRPAAAKAAVNGVGARAPTPKENKAQAEVEEKTQQGANNEPCELFAQTGVPLAYSQTYPSTSQAALSNSQSMSEDTSDLDLRLQSSDGELLDGTVNGNGNVSSSDLEYLDHFAPASAPSVSASKAPMPDLMDSVIGRPDDTDDDLINAGGDGQTLDLHVPPPAEFSDAPPDVVVDSEITVEVGNDGSGNVPVTDIDDLLGLMSSSVDSSPQHTSRAPPPSANGRFEDDGEGEEVLIATMEPPTKSNLDLLLDLDAPPLPSSIPPPVPSSPPQAGLSEGGKPLLPSCPPPPIPTTTRGDLEDFEMVNASECLVSQASPAVPTNGARDDIESGAGRAEMTSQPAENVTSLSVPGADARGREEDDYVTKVNIEPPEIPERCPDLKDDLFSDVAPQKRIINVGLQISKVDVVAEPKKSPPSPKPRKPKTQTSEASKVITIKDEQNHPISGPTVISVDANANHTGSAVQANGSGDEDLITPVLVKKDEAERPLGLPLTTDAVFETKIEYMGDSSESDDIIRPMAVQRDSIGRQYVIETTPDAIRKDTAPREMTESSKLAVTQTLIELSNSMSLKKKESPREEETVAEDDIVPVAISREEAAKVLEILSVWNPSKAKPEKPAKSPFRRMVGEVMHSEEKEDKVSHSDVKPVDEIMQADVKQTVSSAPPPSPPRKTMSTPKNEPTAQVEETVVLRRKSKSDTPPAMESDKNVAQPSQPAAEIMQAEVKQSMFSSPPKKETIPKNKAPAEEEEPVVLRRKPRAGLPAARESEENTGLPPEAAVDRGDKTAAQMGAAGSLERATRVSVTEKGDTRSPASRHSVAGWTSTKGEATQPNLPSSAGQEASLSAASKMSSTPLSPARTSAKTGGDTQQAAPTSSFTASLKHPDVTLRSHSSSTSNRSLMASRRVSSPVGSLKAPTLAPLKISPKISSLMTTPLLTSINKQSKVEYPKTRCLDQPFQVDVLNGILGLGMKVKVTSEGHVEVTEIQKNSALCKNGNVRVGDYILSINGTELTGQTDLKVQQILRLLPRRLVKIVASTLPPDQIKDAASDSAPADSMQSNSSPVTSPQPSGMVSPFGVRMSARPFSAVITTDVTATSPPISSPRRFSSSETNGSGDATHSDKVDGEGGVAPPHSDDGSGDSAANHDERGGDADKKEVEVEVMTQETVTKSEAATRRAPKEWEKRDEPEVLVQKVVLHEEAEASTGGRRPKPSPRRGQDSQVTVSVNPPHVATVDGDVTVKVKGPSGKVPPPVAPKPKGKPEVTHPPEPLPVRAPISPSKPAPSARGPGSSVSIRERMNVYENVAVQGKPVFDSSSIQKKASHGPAVTTISITAATNSPPATAKFATEVRVSDSPTHTMTRYKGSHIAEKSAVPMASEVERLSSSHTGLTSTPAKLHSGPGRKVFGASAFSGKEDEADSSTSSQSPVSPTRRSVASPTEASPAPKFESPDACSTAVHDSHSLSMSSPPTSPTKPGDLASHQPLEGLVIVEPALNRALAPRRKSHPAQSPVAEKPAPDPLAALRRKPKHSLPELSQSDVEAAAASVAAEQQKSAEKVKAPPPVPPKPRNRKSLIEQAEAALQGDIAEAAADTCIFDSSSDIKPKFVEAVPTDVPPQGVVEVKIVETVPVVEDSQRKHLEFTSDEIQREEITEVKAGQAEASPVDSQSADVVDKSSTAPTEAVQTNSSLLVLDDAIESEVEGSNPTQPAAPKSDLLTLDDTIDSEAESAVVLTPGVSASASADTKPETKEEKLAEEIVSEVVEETLEAMKAPSAESAPRKKEEEEDEQEASTTEPTDEDRSSRSPSPPPLPSSPPPLPMSPPPFSTTAPRPGELGSVTTEELDVLLSKDDSGLDSLSGSNGHFSSMDLDTVETINSDDGQLDVSTELPSAKDSIATPDQEDEPEPEEKIGIEEAAGRVVKQVCEAAYKRYSAEQQEQVSNDTKVPPSNTSETPKVEEELVAEVKVTTEASPPGDTTVEVEEVVVPKKVETHKKLEDAFAALTDFPVDDEEVKVTNKVFLPGDATNSKAAAFGDAFADVTAPGSVPASSSAPQSEAKQVSPSPVPRARKQKPAAPAPRAEEPQVEVHEDFSQHVSTSVAAAPSSTVHSAPVEEDAPPPLPTAKVPPLIPSPQASDSPGSSEGGVRGETIPAAVATTPPGDDSAAKAQATTGIYSAVKMDVTRDSKTVSKDIVSNVTSSKDEVRVPEVTSVEVAPIPGLELGETGRSVEIKSSRNWTLISNHSGGPLLEGASNSSRTITASDLSQVSLLSPGELGRLIHAVNDRLDKGRQREEYAILIVLLYRDTPDEHIGIELLAGRSGIILVRSCRRKGLAVRSGLVRGGDLLMTVNGQSSEGRTSGELTELLERPDQHLILALARGVDAVFLSDGKSPRSPTGPSPPETPTHSPRGEEVVFEVVIVKGVTGVGFSLEGGKDSIKGDLPITIKRIFKGGPADKCGQLQIGDAILKVNDLDFTSMRHYEAWNHLKFLPDGDIKLLVRREK